MHLHGLLGALTAHPTFTAVLTALQNGESLPDQYLVRSARPFVVAGLASQLQRPIVILTSRTERAYNITEQLPVWLPDARISRFAEPNNAFYERAPWSEETQRARLETLGLLANWTAEAPPPIIITSAHALMQKTLPMREFKLGSRRLSVGQRFHPEKLMRLWLDLGYEAVTLVAEPGQFSHRGGIVDVYPPSERHPIRLEFFDDEIESIRSFDAASQRSLESLKDAHFSPMREALPKYGPKVAEILAGWFQTQAADDDAISALPDYEALQGGLPFAMLEYYLPWLYHSQPTSLLNYLPENTLILIDDWKHLRESMAEQEESALDLRESLSERGLIPPDMPLPYFTWDELTEALETLHPLHLGSADTQTPLLEGPVLGDLFTSENRFAGQLRRVLEYLSELRGGGDRTITVTRQAEHLAQLWAERNAYILPIENIAQLDDLGSTNFLQGELGEGWIFTEGKNRRLHLLTDAEIFGWKRPEPRRRQRPKVKTPESFFADLQEGDYVVHVEHGIGRFMGLIRRTVHGEDRELLVIEYAGNDQLFVPIHQAERITPYIGSDDEPPKLNRLGTQEWSRTRKKASEAAENMAKELLKLYATRELASRPAYSPDTPWQHELEASFPYVETEDQLRALREVKADMEAPRPMDRLICGDVGYGKTEVALRAAFKAVMDHRQVAILVPTTILADQHYRTFSQRLAPFPVKVEMLSRFRSDAEQTAIIAKLTSGELDIVIGTHRLLGSDVKFKNLGLVIIDEEQRFGITHKEQLKQLRNEVDVLALSATPIPRTLYMSITGLRDISTINTPPEERLPVATHVGLYEEKLVRQAILREIERGGQVFIVHNRVQSIPDFTDKLRGLVPEATFTIAHGQMHEDKLEQVILEFTQGEYDVLVSTSIIENGLDIPNANTIIIDRADRFGLAPLYQLRGRVGRGANQGYAYFLHPSPRKMTDEARARLDTIREETQLGAGLAVAMRDLEIRGAGDLLGKRQSGHIAAVGFHLYTQMLSEAVRKLKARAGQDIPPPAITPITVDLPIPAYIPREYIPETSLRIQFYRFMTELSSLSAVDDLHTELTDRFGSVPSAVEGLLYQLRVKLLASQVHATAIVREQDKLGIKLPYLGQIDRYQLQVFLGEPVRVSRIAVWLDVEKNSDKWMDLLLDVLNKLQAVTLPEEAA